MTVTRWQGLNFIKFMTVSTAVISPSCFRQSIDGSHVCFRDIRLMFSERVDAIVRIFDTERLFLSLYPDNMAVRS